MPTESSYSNDSSVLESTDGVSFPSNNLTLSAYNDLNVPTGATINGITLDWVGGAGGWSSENKVMYVSNNGGNSFGGPLNTDDDISDLPTLRPAQYGGATNLWGLTWTAEQANAIQTKFLFVPQAAVEQGGTTRHDSFKITIHYTARVENGKITISSGLVKVSSGKITIS
tara:strand:+ start:107 stop:616 length:510 start_codon:yes stop_codon:yes gene_type:complete